MAFTDAPNTLPATGAAAMWTLISTLITAGWVKTADSDGTTYSAGGTQVTSGAAGAGGLGNANAWVVLRAPAVNGQQRSWCFQRGADNRNWRIKYSAAAGFTGGSPGAARVPSAADEAVKIGAGTDASPTFTSWFAADGGTYRWHGFAGGAAEGYSWFFWAINTGSTTTSVGIFQDVLAAGSYAEEDTDPAVVYVATPGSSVVSEVTSNSATVSNPSRATAWLGSTATPSNHVNVGLYTLGTSGVGSVWGGIGITLGSSPFTGKDVFKAATWLRSGGAAPVGPKGESTLFQWGSVSRTNMDTLNDGGTKNKIFLNGVVVGHWAGVDVLT